MAPIRELDMKEVMDVSASELRDVTLKDLKESLGKVRRSVAGDTLKAYEEWNKEFGDVSG